MSQLSFKDKSFGRQALDMGAAKTKADKMATDQCG
jgi:hypothetical protein